MILDLQVNTIVHWLKTPGPHLRGQRTLPVAQNDAVARLYRATEGYDVPVLPHIRDKRVARIDRRGEARIEAGYERVVVVADRVENRPASNAVRTTAMQQWPGETRLARDRGIGVQGVTISRKAEQECLVGSRDTRAAQVRIALRQQVPLWQRALRAADSAIAPRDQRAVEREEGSVVFFQPCLGLHHDHGAVRDAPVVHPQYPPVQQQLRRGRQRPVQLEWQPSEQDF